MKDSKNMVIGMLCAVVCVMAVAYAAFGTALNVKTTATVASNWCVKVSSATCSDDTVDGGVAPSVASKAEVTTNSLGADLTMNFVQPGDVVTCTVVYENCGSLNAAITHAASMVVNGVNTPLTANEQGIAIDKTADDGIEFTVSGLNAETLAAGATQTNGIQIVGKYLDVAAGQGSPAVKSATISVKSSASQSTN